MSIQNNDSITDTNKIFWMGNTQSAFHTLRQGIAREIRPVNIELVSDLQSFANLELGDTGVFVFEIPGEFAEQVFSRIEEVRTRWPSIPRILLLAAEREDFFLKAVNEAGAFSVFNLLSSPIEIAAQIFDAFRWRERDEDRSSLIQNIKKQNQYLEELTLGQTELVQARTQELQESKKLAENKVANISKLILFVKDLADLVAVEELVEILREEIKKFHHVQEPILACTLPNQLRKIFHFQAGKVQVRPIKENWPQGVRIRINEKDDSQYLANAFSRPFGKVIAIPLPAIKRTGGEDKGELGVIFFENALSQGEKEEFLAFVSERLQPLSIALDRVMLEQELRNTSHLWEQSFDGIEEPIAIVDYEYALLRANRSFTTEINVSTCHKAFRGSKEICPGCPVKEALETSGPVVSQVKKDSRLFEVHSYPIHLPDGSQPTTVVNHYLDVTRAHLLQEQMAQNEKVAAVGHLAGHIAHELNNPLTGIRSTAQILLHDRKPGNNLYSDLVEVEKAAGRCQSIIRNLLEFSRGGGEVPLREVSLNDIIEKTLPLLKTAMNPFIKEVELSEENTLIRVEPQLIQQVIFNIVNNACQAMGEQGTLWITSSRDVEDGVDYVDFRVKDSGKGIPFEIQESIFDPFFTTKSEQMGTGLGLSMSKRVVEGFGGKIWVWSEPDQGTEFTVRLPLATAGGGNQ